MCRLCVRDIDLVNERNKGEWVDLEGILNYNHLPMISTLLGMIEIMVITFKWLFQPFIRGYTGVASDGEKTHITHIHLLSSY